MGREARARSKQADVRDSWPVYWHACRVCCEQFPSLFKPDERVEHLDVCQRCCVADIAGLMRTHPQTVRMLPTVMALEGRPIVAPIVGGSVTQALLEARDEGERPPS